MTLAELSSDEKNSVSARLLAIKNLKNKLSK
jgi:inosine/xanthosine triphosphate pyrophosphatase family protein